MFFTLQLSAHVKCHSRELHERRGLTTVSIKKSAQYTVASESRSWSECNKRHTNTGVFEILPPLVSWLDADLQATSK